MKFKKKTHCHSVFKMCTGLFCILSFNIGCVCYLIRQFFFKGQNIPFNLPSMSKDLHMPSGDSIPSFMNCAATAGFKQRFEPPTIAESQSPVLMQWRAWSMASRLDEQAVSTV